MSQDDLRKRFAISPLLDVEIDIGAFGLVGLDARASHDVRVNVTAAALATQLGYKSVDRVRKNYASYVSEHQARDLPARELYLNHAELYERFYASFGAGRDNEPIGVFAFDLTMVRAREAIRLLLITARQGFSIEPALIARSIVEKFAYAIYVWDKIESDDIFEVEPQSLIKHLKIVYPSVGRAYGMLSELSHYDPSQHYKFINFQDGSIAHRSWNLKIEAMTWIFFILDMKFKIFKQIYGNIHNFLNLEAKI